MVQTLYDIVKAQVGELSVETKDEEGSVFSFLLSKNL